MSDAPLWKIPLSDLDYGAEEMAAVQRVVAGKWLSMGPEVQAFEAEFAAMQKAAHALAVSNATAGLHLALLALGIGPGDEVIQPALNFVAAANMTVAAGATPVFGDIVSLEEPTLDPAEAERLITSRTKAIVVMHYGGDLCRMAEFAELCRRRGIALIEDACHAVGAAYHEAQGRPPHGIVAGSIGDVGVFSFFANKNLSTGEGGMVVTHRDDLAQRLRLLRSHGMTSLTWDRHKGHAQSYEVVTNGYNYRLDELHAALGRAQLAKLEGFNRRRRALRKLYFERLRPLEGKGWALPFSQAPGEPSAYLIVAVAPDPAARSRAAQALREARIQSSLHYPCVSDFEAFRRWRSEEVPKTRRFCGGILTLPLFSTMTEEMVETVSALMIQAASAP